MSYKVTFVQADGTRTDVAATDGQNLMNLAVANNVPGILGECGGACACGTCHCYVEAGWVAKLPAPDENEASMIEFVVDPNETSRLSCQLKMTAELDGLTVHLPAAQY